jgi:hypothetical protein
MKVTVFAMLCAEFMTHGLKLSEPTLTWEQRLRSESVPRRGKRGKREASFFSSVASLDFLRSTKQSDKM